MDQVGDKGAGESVWLAFFFCSVLAQFKTVAQQQGDSAFADVCATEFAKLQNHIETTSWDGAWYRRAYFDDGTPLGSAANTECRIDAIAQSWSVLSKVASLSRARQAMASSHQYLVRSDDRIILLLDPPFNISKPSPGYIESYLPGIRENGGQYTHAAVWTILAFLELGEISLAWQLFNMINPVNHGSTSAEVGKYTIEPYVTAGDVYSVSPHNGHGGWSWYTGSAGWMYQLIVEGLLGLRLLSGSQLQITPHLPQGWEPVTVSYRYKETNYQITLKQGDKYQITQDNVPLADNKLNLIDDKKTHDVLVSVKC